ncbi:hypothetical protein M4D55_17990 [Metabacillus idriensis]|uniref:hypothetical protein n=1 Tax=Metabacillus idriensis TaxID=324768 RepID=UPI0008A9CE64|nr:hypothetical protein [Metabacillus idriensis]MCM3597661.1 hypothetical protein [Metabacillus idriensis]OHR65822.1 hypothetical protein HMPREF3291_01940 [Bacillus sp. HMSC76G11]
MDLFSFVEKMNASHFIQPLLPIEELRIQITSSGSKQKPVLLVLKKGTCYLSSGNDHLSAHVLVTGNEDHLSDCFHTPIRLLQLAKLGALEVKGSFRNVLRLESIIQLAK